MTAIRLTTLALITSLVVPTIAHSGGPVIVEEPPIADVRPQGDGGKWVVPVIVGAIVLCAFLCDGGDDAPDVVPGPVCNGGGEGC